MHAGTPHIQRLIIVGVASTYRLMAVILYGRGAHGVWSLSVVRRLEVVRISEMNYLYRVYATYVGVWQVFCLFYVGFSLL